MTNHEMNTSKATSDKTDTLDPEHSDTYETNLWTVGGVGGLVDGGSFRTLLTEALAGSVIWLPIPEPRPGIKVNI